MIEQISTNNETRIEIPISNFIGETQTKLTGQLDSIITNSGRCHLQIYSEFGYLIYSGELAGVNYLPIRISPINIDGEKFNHEAEKFKLNENLLIRVQAFDKMEEFKIIIRWN